MEGRLHVGLMSGTSLDGVDGVVVDLGAGGDRGDAALQVLAHAHLPFDPALVDELLALNTPGADELHRSALAANALTRRYADVVDALFDGRPELRRRASAIGVHGQTVRHCPQHADGIGYTLQLNNPALLAELTGIDVIADFRSRDLAAGGQGAPLAPAFHRAVFARREGKTVAVLNLGGIANLTVLRPDGATLGFDCGPANALLDHWCQRHTGAAFDDRGAWGASGQVVPSLLDAMLASTPYFVAAPPKSTGRDLFNPAWLAARLDAWRASSAAPPPAPQDVQATLAELTAVTCGDEVRRHAREATELIVCGGGAMNTAVTQRLAGLTGVPVVSSDDRGLPASQVEACAFAWLAREFEAGRVIDLRSVTGARAPRRLGALYPAARRLQVRRRQ